DWSSVMCSSDLARLRRGVWDAAEGMVYSDYLDAVHVVDTFPIPDHWTRYLAVDFGYTNPFVALWWAEDPDGRLYLYRVIYHTRRTVDQHARDRKSTRLNSSHVKISYAVFCLKKKKK